MVSRKIVAIIFILALGISLATAEEIRHHEFDTNDINRLSLDIRTGHIIVEHHDQQVISVEVRLSEENEGWFRRSPDLTNMDIRQSLRNSQLTLSFDEKHVDTEWIIRIPSLEQFDLNLGVGAAELVMINTDITVNIGVGAVEMNLALARYGEIQMSTGVGDTAILGARSTESNRALVSSHISGKGEGEYTVSANLGVGSAEVKLSQNTAASRS